MGARRGQSRPVHRRVLVLGGARSGKSSFAEGLAGTLGDPVLYVATATALDDEMVERIHHHQARRPGTWRTVEEPLVVASAVARSLDDARTVLLEDLTLLLANFMVGPDHAGAPQTAAEAERRTCEQLDALLQMPANLVLVSNEVGMGLVPTYPLGRAFRDALGRVNQRAAAQVSEVYFLLAGLPVMLKPSPAPASRWRLATRGQRGGEVSPSQERC